MKAKMEQARAELVRLIEAHGPTAGMDVRKFGDHLILSRPDPSAAEGEPETDDRLRLTALSARRWGLSLKRHNGRWEKTPFTGGLDELVTVILNYMQHLA
jgi:hypothetical protein